MTMTINSVAHDAESLQNMICTGSNRIDCKNYEIGLIPEMDLVYVYGKNLDLVISSIIVGPGLANKGRSSNLSHEELIRSGKRLYSGGCIAVTVWMLPDKSYFIKVTQKDDSASIYFKVEKTSLVSS